MCWLVLTRSTETSSQSCNLAASSQSETINHWPTHSLTDWLTGFLISGASTFTQTFSPLAASTQLGSLVLITFSKFCPKNHPTHLETMNQKHDLHKSKLCPGHELLYLTPSSDVAIHNVKTDNITIVLNNSSYVSISQNYCPCILIIS